MSRSTGLARVEEYYMQRLLKRGIVDQGKTTDVTTRPLVPRGISGTQGSALHRRRRRHRDLRPNLLGGSPPPLPRCSLAIAAAAHRVSCSSI